MLSSRIFIPFPFKSLKKYVCNNAYRDFSRALTVTSGGQSLTMVIWAPAARGWRPEAAPK